MTMLVCLCCWLFCLIWVLLFEVCVLGLCVYVGYCLLFVSFVLLALDCLGVLCGYWFSLLFVVYWMHCLLLTLCLCCKFDLFCCVFVVDLWFYVFVCVTGYWFLIICLLVCYWLDLMMFILDYIVVVMGFVLVCFVFSWLPLCLVDLRLVVCQWIWFWRLWNAAVCTYVGCCLFISFLFDLFLIWWFVRCVWQLLRLLFGF